MNLLFFIQSDTIDMILSRGLYIILVGIALFSGSADIGFGFQLEGRALSPSIHMEADLV